MSSKDSPSAEARRKLFDRLFRPPCFGDTIHCPVLFTSKMYICQYYEECEEESLRRFKERCRSAWMRNVKKTFGRNFLNPPVSEKRNPVKKE